MKKLIVVLNQKFENQTIKEEFTVNVLSNPEKFSAKHFRKLFQRAANKVLSLDGKQLAISKGRKFQMSITFEEITISKFTTFFNSAERVQNNFNRNLNARLKAAIVDIKDLIETEHEASKPVTASAN